MNPFLASALFILAYMIFWFVLAQIQNDNSIVDAAWGLGFVGVAWVIQFFYLDQFILPTLLITLWGVRLSTYLGIRYYRSTKEDWRYTNLKKGWKGNLTVQAFLRVFLLQGIVMWFLLIPVMQAPGFETSTNFLIIPGTIIFTFGWLWQSIADWQLFQFKSDSKNKGKTLMTGLWKYSRHPNYFGEILVWWGIFLICTPFGYWWLSLISPVLITFLLTRVSGVTMLEAKMGKDAEYADYMKRTNALLPKYTVT